MKAMDKKRGVATAKATPTTKLNVRNGTKVEKIVETAKKRDSFVFYRSFFDGIDEAPIEEQRNIYRAIVMFGLDGLEPNDSDFSAMGKIIWKMAKPQLEANWKKYNNGCKGAPYGNRGGAPKGNTNAKKQPQNNPKTTPNDNDNVNVNDNDNDKKENTIVSKKDFSLSTTSPRFEKMNEWLRQECPHVAKMEKQLSEDEFEKLLKKFGSAATLSEWLSKLENSKIATKNNRSVYRTISNWVKRDGL